MDGLKHIHNTNTYSLYLIYAQRESVKKIGFLRDMSPKLDPLSTEGTKMNKSLYFLLFL